MVRVLVNENDWCVRNAPYQLSVAVTPEEHQIFTNAWRSAIGYNNQVMDWTTTNATPEKVWQVAQDIYKDYPALINAVRITLSK